MYEKEKEELAAICHLLYERNLVTATDGNVSVRASAEHLLLTPSGKNKGFVRASDILVLDLSGNTLEGAGKASREFPMHRAVYAGRPDIFAVVHTHPVFATAFAVAGKNIPDNCLIETKMMLKRIALADYATPGTEEMAEAISAFIPDYEAVLLKNHGALTYGKNLMDAFNKMEVLESIAKTVIVSGAVGKPAVISADQMAKMGR